MHKNTNKAIKFASYGRQSLASGSVLFGEFKDLDTRKNVWITLSDLFLDSDYAIQSYVDIAASLAQTNYSIEQLEHILDCEVAPIVEKNLLSFAGVWDGFDPDWLEAEIIKNASLTEPEREAEFSHVKSATWKKIKSEIVFKRTGERLREESLWDRAAKFVRCFVCGGL